MTMFGSMLPLSHRADAVNSTLLMLQNSIKTSKSLKISSFTDTFRNRLYTCYNIRYNIQEGTASIRALQKFKGPLNIEYKWKPVPGAENEM